MAFLRSPLDWCDYSTIRPIVNWINDYKYICIRGFYSP